MALNKLTAKRVETEKSPGRYSDGGGLYLLIDDKGYKRWTLRFTIHGKTRETGLGGIDSVTLASARQKAVEIRAQVANGIDPIQKKAVVRAEVAQSSGHTLESTLKAYIKAKGGEWKSDKHRDQWTMTVSRGAAAIYKKPLASITEEDVLAVLKPYFYDQVEKGKVTQPARLETGSRLRARIEILFSFAKASKFIPRETINPAVWKGHLEHILPSPNKRKKAHHAALPYKDLPAFIAQLQTQDGVSPKALEFAILTAARTGEIIGATWDEIDFQEKVWTVPEEKMKAGSAHAVPLSPRAWEIIEAMQEVRVSEFIFPGWKNNKPLSNMAMDSVLRRMDLDVTVHGFRSTFRDWAGDKTEFKREVIEFALAHKVGSEVEAAYRRGTAFEKRTELMQVWADYCVSSCEQ